MKYAFLLMAALIPNAASLSAELPSADFDGMNSRDYTDAIQNVGRLCAQLNKRIFSYAKANGYLRESWMELFDFADCLIDRQDNKVHIILYFRRGDLHDVFKDYTSRLTLANHIQQFMMGLCRNFIYKNITPSNVKIIVKYREMHAEKDSDILFIWDEGEVEYFPQYFDNAP